MLKSSKSNKEIQLDLKINFIIIFFIKQLKNTEMLKKVKLIKINQDF